MLNCSLVKKILVQWCFECNVVVEFRRFFVSIVIVFQWGIVSVLVGQYCFLNRLGYCQRFFVFGCYLRIVKSIFQLF